MKKSLIYLILALIFVIAGYYILFSISWELAIAIFFLHTSEGLLKHGTDIFKKELLDKKAELIRRYVRFAKGDEN